MPQRSRWRSRADACWPRRGPTSRASSVGKDSGRAPLAVMAMRRQADDVTTNSRIDSVAVLGAGTMGAQIAAHVANAGLPVLLLDLDDRTAREGLKRAKALKPDPCLDAEVASPIVTASFDTLLDRRGESDWIIEAVVERLDIKRALLERVDA